MTYRHDATIDLLSPVTLPLAGFRAYLFQLLLMAATVLLPVIAHWTGAPVMFLLPMHWPVLMAGLVYGWRGGALTGVLAPMASFILSGLPLPVILPAMTLELLAYGLVTGLLKEKGRWNGWLAVGAALVAGRILFLGTALLFKVPAAAVGLVPFAQKALLPGVIAALLQLALLPLLAGLWVRAEQGRREKT